MAATLILSSGDPFAVTDKTATQLLALVQLGSWFQVTTDSLPGPDSRMWVRPGAVVAIAESS